MEAAQQPASEPQGAPEVYTEPTSSEGTDPTEAAAASSEPLSEEAVPALPVPVAAPPEKRSLWRRLTGRGDARRVEDTGFQDLVKSRLDGITLRLESFEHALTRTDARLEGRLELLERLEARLDDLADIGERADAAQQAARKAAEAAERAAGAARNAAVIAGLAAVAAAAALFVALG